MSDPILYHYPMSPYGQKIRAMLGYVNIPWTSVITTEAPPRPTIELLVGGYRRIPIMQLGADFFCDTALIAREIEAFTGRNDLNLMQADSVKYGIEFESEQLIGFLVAASGWGLTKKAVGSMTIKRLFHVMKDRIKLIRKAKSGMVPIPFKKAVSLVQTVLQDLETRLADSPFLFGDQPTFADFCVYHGIWYWHELGGKQAINNYPQATGWYQRMKKFDIGCTKEMDDAYAIAQANENTPRPLPENSLSHSDMGKEVQIAPTDYGSVPTRGKLVGLYEDRWVLARGTTHIHFPSHYQLSPVDTPP